MTHVTAMGSGEAALDCHPLCLEAVTYCPSKGGDRARPEHAESCREMAGAA